MIIELEVQEGLHIPPRWIDLNFGGFQEVCVCGGCGMNIAKSAINSYAPCKNCGDDFNSLRTYVGIFKNKKWNKKIGENK